MRTHIFIIHKQHLLTTSYLFSSTEDTLEKEHHFPLTSRRSTILPSVHDTLLPFRPLSEHNVVTIATNQSFPFSWLAPDTADIVPPFHSPLGDAPRVAVAAIHTPTFAEVRLPSQMPAVLSSSAAFSPTSFDVSPRLAAAAARSPVRVSPPKRSIHQRPTD